MNINIHESDITKFEGKTTDRCGPRLWIHQKGGDISTIWLSREQAKQLVAELAKLFPEPQPEADGVAAYADDHAGDLDTVAGPKKLAGFHDTGDHAGDVETVTFTSI